MGLCDAYNLTSREFYFDRSPKIFENILGLYRKGELHLTESVCPRDFLGELDYWGLSALHLGQLTVQWWIVQCTTPTFHLYNILIHTLHTKHKHSPISSLKWKAQKVIIDFQSHVVPTPCRTTNVKLSEIIFLIEKLQQLRTCAWTCLVSDLTQFHIWTLQRASWLLPIVDSGIDESEEVRANFFKQILCFMENEFWGRLFWWNVLRQPQERHLETVWGERSSNVRPTVSHYWRRIRDITHYNRDITGDL